MIKCYYRTKPKLTSLIQNTNSSFENTNSSFENTNSSFENTNSSFENTNSSFENTNSSFENTNSSFENTNSSVQNTNSSFKTVADTSRNIGWGGGGEEGGGEEGGDDEIFNMYAFGVHLRYANLSNIMLGISNSLLIYYCNVTITLYAYILVRFLVPCTCS